MGQITWSIVEKKVSDLKSYEHNPRVLTKKGIADLKKSIDKFGLAEPIVVNTDNVIIGGHARTKVLDSNAIVQCYVPSRELNEDEYKELNIRLNKNIAGEWDFDILANSFELSSLLEWGFDEKELKFDLPVEEDDVPEVDDTVDPTTKLGDIYKLGEHRLMCGDSTSIDDVEKLMDGQKADMVLTDPPYNTGMEAKADSTRLNHMFKDSYTDEEWDVFLQQVFSNLYTATKGEATFYICIDWRRVSDIKNHLEAIIPVSNVIVWDKMVHGLGSDYKYTYELIVVGKKGKPEINNRHGTDYRDVWHVQRKVGKNEDHATAKPVELCSKPIVHASKQDDIVLDLFGGSGSTLIASEQLGRKCYMMELDPKYCDVIVKRWEQFTGEQAQIITDK